MIGAQLFAFLYNAPGRVGVDGKARYAQRVMLYNGVSIDTDPRCSGCITCIRVKQGQATETGAGGVFGVVGIVGLVEVGASYKLSRAKYRGQRPFTLMGTNVTLGATSVIGGRDVNRMVFNGGF